jgi:cation transport regulator ChaB
MPYQLDKPPDTIKNIPKGAQKIWIETFNAVEDESKDENLARQAGWKNVKEKYHKVDGKWVLKSALVDISLTITKASLHNGTMRWQAVASDTSPDNKGEATSLPLFQDWVERIEKGTTVPFLPPPRRPFLGLSHYPSLDGYGEAGPTEKMYIDGECFKAGGTFFDDKDHPLGKALFEAVQKEQSQIKKGNTVDQPIRISAAWWDLKHQHGDFVFERKSLDELCPMCEKGKTDNKVYLAGQLDHLAATRVPINPRTSLALEEKAMTDKITREEDAASIVGEEQAAQIEEKSQQMVGKSETEELPTGMIVKADEETGTEPEDEPEATTEKAMTKTVGGKKYPASDFLVVEDQEMPSTWHLQVKRNGKPDHNLMGGAWASLHGGYRGNIYEGPSKQKAISALKRLYNSEDMETPPIKKADLETPTMAVAMGEEHGYMPLNGATSMDEAMNFLKTREMLDKAYTRYDVFRMVMENIMQYLPQEEQMMATRKAVDAFSNEVATIKAAVEDVYLNSPAIEQEQNMSDQQIEQVEETPLQKAHVAVMEAMQTDGDGKVPAVQKALNAYAEAIQVEIDAQPAQPESQPNLSDQITQGVLKGLAGFMEQVTQLNERLSTQSQQPQVTVQPVQLPQQKSFSTDIPVNDPAQQAANQLPLSPFTGKPSPLRAIINRSVGIQ